MPTGQTCPAGSLRLLRHVMYVFSNSGYREAWQNQIFQVIRCDVGGFGMPRVSFLNWFVGLNVFFVRRMLCVSMLRFVLTNVHDFAGKDIILDVHTLLIHTPALSPHYTRPFHPRSVFQKLPSCSRKPKRIFVRMCGRVTFVDFFFTPIAPSFSGGDRVGSLPRHVVRSR